MKIKEPRIFFSGDRSRTFVIVPHYDKANDCYYVTSYVHRRDNEQRIGACDSCLMEQVTVGSERPEELEILRKAEKIVLDELNV